jgi:CelD/BcsL family acetyltransferase involved in cellulose biosynthesis
LYRIDISTLQDIGQLERSWTTLEDEVEEVPFFLSWAWISTWLTSYKPLILKVEATYHGKTVCIGLFTYSNVTRRKLIRACQLRLHQTGIQSQDQIWIEYNDFLVPRQHREIATMACLQRLLAMPDWDELVISMMPHGRANQIVKALPNTRITQSSPTYALPLSSFSRNPTQFLPSLSSNTRYQIQKSNRLYSQDYGAIAIEVADTKRKAIDFLHLAGLYHKQRWKDSGFNNQDFIHFHERLIRSTHDSCQTLLMKISAGNQIIGVLYYLLDAQTAYFYLQGLNYEKNPKLKPGLTAHSLAIQHFIEHGKTSYDFMGGYSQYKKQLAQLSHQLDILVIQKLRLRFSVENLARKIKAGLS